MWEKVVVQQVRYGCLSTHFDGVGGLIAVYTALYGVERAKHSTDSKQRSVVCSVFAEVVCCFTRVQVVHVAQEWKEESRVGEREEEEGATLVEDAQPTHRGLGSFGATM